MEETTRRIVISGCNIRESHRRVGCGGHMIKNALLGFRVDDGKMDLGTAPFLSWRRTFVGAMEHRGNKKHVCKNEQQCLVGVPITPHV